MATNVIDILENTTAISLEVTQWGGRKKLQSDDLRGNVVVPPDTLASLGSKKIYDPKELSKFNTLKAQAEKVLRNNGVGRTIARSCWVVPNHLAKDVIDELRAIKVEFDSALTTFLANYDAKLEEWLSENDEWRGIIENALMSKNEVRERISFGWHAFSFGSTSIPGVNDELEGKLTGLTGQLFSEIAQKAKDSFDKSFLDEDSNYKDKVLPKALGPLSVMRNKLHGFSVCSALVMPIVEDIDRVLVAIPDNGLPIEGIQLIGLRGLLTLLKDPREAMDYAQRKLDGKAGKDPWAAWSNDNGFSLDAKQLEAVGNTTEADGQTLQVEPEPTAAPEIEPEIEAEAMKESLPEKETSLKAVAIPLMLPVEKGEDPFADDPSEEPEQAPTIDSTDEPEAPAEGIQVEESEEEPLAALPEEETEAPALETFEEDEDEDLPEIKEEDDDEDDYGVAPLSFDDDSAGMAWGLSIDHEFEPLGDFCGTPAFGDLDDELMVDMSDFDLSPSQPCLA